MRGGGSEEEMVRGKTLCDAVERKEGRHRKVAARGSATVLVEFEFV